MKPIDDHLLDLFPTAEALFKDCYDDIMLLENRRRNLIFVSIISTLLIALIIFFLLPFVWSLMEPGLVIPSMNIYPFYSLALMAAYIPIQYSLLDSFYRSLAKRKFLSILARHLRMQYRRGGFFPLIMLYDHHILPPYAIRKVEEGFSGKFKGFKIEFQDFLINPIKRIYDGTGYRSIVTRQNYYGLVMRVELNKRFKHHTVLLPAKEQKSFLANLPNENLFFHEDVNMVYSGFTRHYVCLSTNQIEARYILDPAVMERFVKLAESFGTDKISASFKDNQMVIVLRPVLNLFEIGSLRDPVTVLTIERTLHQIYALRQIAEIFELNSFAGLGATVTGRVD
ncbi:MAG: DUF3137 domain-containing protein [Micavibrio sp.]